MQQATLPGYRLELLTVMYSLIQIKAKGYNYIFLSV